MVFFVHYNIVMSYSSVWKKIPEQHYVKYAVWLNGNQFLVDWTGIVSANGIPIGWSMVERN